MLNFSLIAGGLQVFNGDATVGLSTNGFKNRLINGDMRIDQRNAGASQTITAAAALAYSVDRWYVFAAGANVTGQQTTVSAQKRYIFTGAASVTGIGIGQRIEATNCLDMAGGQATLQAKLSSTSLTTITWTAYYATTTDAFGTLASPTRTSFATGSFTINGTEAIYSVPVSVPAAATTGIEIVFTGGALLATQTFTIGDVQFESGNFASSFERPPIRTALAYCQRYFWTVNASIGGTYSAYFSGGCVLKYPVTMRSVPTLLAGAAFTVNSGSSGTVFIPAPSNIFGNMVEGTMVWNSAGNWTVGASVGLQCQLSAEL